MPRILPALALTLCLAPAAPSLAQTALAKGTASGLAAQLDAELTTGPHAAIHAAIAHHFPAEAAALQAQFAAALAQAQAAGLPAPSGIAAGRALLARLAPNLSGAPDADLIAILSDQIAMYAALADRPDTCARIVVDGLAGADLVVLAGAGHDMAAATDRLYRAMAVGQGQPRRGPATQDHYAALVAMLGPIDQAIALIRTLERQDRTDPALCGATIAFLSATRDARFAGADLLRAEVLGLLFEG